MRMITTDEIINISCDLFNDYVEPAAVAIMSGEVPSIVFNLHLSGTKDKDWLATTKFKNTPAMSMYHCDLYLEDLDRYCRMCKMWLVTREVFTIVALYSMMHPIYQANFIYYKRKVDTSYEGMMAHAARDTLEFISAYHELSVLEDLTLDVLNYHMMYYLNMTWDPRIRSVKVAHNVSMDNWKRYMLKHYKLAYKMARFRKVGNYLIDEEGLIRMERNNRPNTKTIITDRDIREEPRNEQTKNERRGAGVFGSGKGVEVRY